MISESDRSHGDTIGFTISGDVAKADYEILVPKVAEVVATEGHVNLVCDLSDFRWEKVSAWGADMRFGHEFKHKTQRMAVIGDSAFEKFIIELASSFYAQEAKFFTDADAAWAWAEHGDTST